MKVIIAGGRDFHDIQMVDNEMETLFYVPSKDDYLWNVDEIVSGTARGADQAGENWANRHNLPIKQYPADWDTHGKGAGFIRNAAMAAYADVLVAFWDGKSRGTKHMIDTALKGGLDVHVYNYTA